ncbi:isoprenoid synthase domain-containing protein [Multifurca ochricompacta]|uniref:Squalene synthase n=1 Tax=Multifurca ochricompacta TaxID=376703 RepID=A0AAD4M303_9AGAM|nr:isoprenoid synthase domain-containing protein [Multifurca ochricompacta]
MGALEIVTLALTHPNEFRILLQFWNYHEPRRDITKKEEHATSGWDRPTMRRCWELLDHSSRSFAAVIKELDGDLARVICLFYIVLHDVKQPLLRSFHEKTITPGWSFNGNGPDEKDRIVLVDYPVIVEELLRLEPAYLPRDIVDICHKMETGMADFAHRAALSSEPLALNTIEEYDLYCHYVAGLVGEGLSRLFSATKKESPRIAQQLELSNSLGLLLQKTNIIRDFREDADERRFFWPREIWGSAEFSPDGRTPATDILQLLREPKRAAWVQSAMVVDALRHTCDALDYLRLLKNQSVFNFAAIPATMALATLDLCFMNTTMFERNIKIRKAKAAELIMRSTNPREVALIFKEYARSIHAKAHPADPNFLRISVACAKIEHWAERNYPSFIRLPSSSSSPSSPTGPSFDPADARSRIAIADAETDRRATEEKRLLEIRERIAGNANGNGNGNDTLSAGALKQQSQGPPWDFLAFVGAAVFLVMAISIGIALAILYFTA